MSSDPSRNRAPVALALPRLLLARARRASMLAVALVLAACGTEPDAPITVDPPVASQGPVAERLPTMEINTTGNVAIQSRETYVPGTYRVRDTSGVIVAEGAIEIRGRGNSTWDLFPKKPYRLRLVTSAPLLGMPASRHWALLANYSDKTLMRNDAVFELSRNLRFEYTPRAQSVDVTLNGDYRGIYQLVEHIRVASDRVNIPTLRASDTTASAISGGYLMEVDERYGEAFCYKSQRTTMVFCLKDPETLNEPAWARQRAYIIDYIDKTDAAIFGPDFADPVKGYAAFIDVPSMIDYYLANELVRNVDGNLRLSTFLYKKRDGKLFFGPLWDYDIAIGNVNYDGADAIQGWQIRRAQWFTRLFQDPAFDAAVKARWRQLTTDRTVDRLLDWMTKRQRYLSKVQAKNFERWPILGSYVWPNRVVTGSYAGEVSAMQDWLFFRRQWMDTQLR